MTGASGAAAAAQPPWHLCQTSGRYRGSAAYLGAAAALLTLCCASGCHASAGDRDPAFRWCVGICAEGDGCVMLPPALKHVAVECTAACPAQFDHAVPPALKALRWSCDDDCRYRCMQVRESVRQEAHAVNATLPATVKYYGKWPFTRVLGMQEVASVLFSLANLAAHAHCLLRFAALLRRLARRGTSGVEAGSRGRSSISSAATNGGSRFDDDGGYSLGRPGSPQRAASSKQRGGDSSSSRGSGGTGGSSSGGAAPSRLGISPGLRLGSAVGSSAVGSGSSRPSLRQLNVAYPFWPLWLVYAAIALTAWAASAAFHARDVKATERTDYLLADALVLFGLLVAVARAFGWTRWRQWGLLTALGGGALAYHAHHMLFVLFDYGLNVAICVALGLAQTITWAVWVGRVRHPCRGQLYTFLLLLNAATLLEIFDFPPLFGLLDAHALWHAATVPLTYRFWAFVMGDAQWWSERTAAATAAEA